MLSVSCFGIAAFGRGRESGATITRRLLMRFGLSITALISSIIPQARSSYCLLICFLTFEPCVGLFWSVLACACVFFWTVVVVSRCRIDVLGFFFQRVPLLSWLGRSLTGGSHPFRFASFFANSFSSFLSCVTLDLLPSFLARTLH
jgi:hypothetical protein